MSHMDRELTPSSRSNKSMRIFNQVPLSSTMLQKSLPSRISAETTDSGLASTSCTHAVSSSETSFRILDGVRRDEAERRQESVENGTNNRNIQTPHSGFMLLRRNLSSRGSSTPKNCVSHCPFPTPDRLNEPFISHEVFENRLLSFEEKNSFSPCIDWQSTMNPTVFDTSNPAAYLPPVRSLSCEQRNERAINAFFQRKIVPSPTPTARRRVAITSSGSRESTMDTKSPSQTLPTSLRAMTTQTDVTIPPDYDIAQIFAPFATFTGVDTRTSTMEVSRSCSSSPTSISSLSRRKLFSEEDFEDFNDGAADGDLRGPEISRGHAPFIDTPALSTPPKTCRRESTSGSLSGVYGRQESFCGENQHEIGIDEIPRGALDIELSPIRPHSPTDEATMDSKYTFVTSPDGNRQEHATENSPSTFDMSIV
ncbi:uncharacterized protein LOC100902147 [Galendromus occidentalis]|uniref:Uncharacterized protein LOC100902147 n=1 Tax=Galendromus occidentalis TaxID=34638 RepID=A0AAJ6QJS4_9ACAR|nr:uncharacterized protein LOC100902147 [Galendromus occidentalis]